MARSALHSAITIHFTNRVINYTCIFNTKQRTPGSSRNHANNTPHLSSSSCPWSRSSCPSSFQQARSHQNSYASLRLVRAAQPTPCSSSTYQQSCPSCTPSGVSLPRAISSHNSRRQQRPHTRASVSHSYRRSSSSQSSTTVVLYVYPIFIQSFSTMRASPSVGTLHT